jgi:hypothetical protein
VLKYVKGTLEFGILYIKSKDPQLFGYTYSDWAGSFDDIKSTSGYDFSLAKGTVTWTNKKKHAIVLSLAEEKYRGAVKGACEGVWLRRPLSNMQMQQTETTPLLCDNQGVIKLAKNPVFHECTKHVEVHFHFIIKLVEDGSIETQYCPIEDQKVDILTKSLGPEKYVKFQDKLGLVSRLSIKGGC